MIPLKLSAVSFAASVFGVVPTQVPPTAPPTALILTRVSVNAALVNGDALVLLNVRVTLSETAPKLLSVRPLSAALPEMVVWP